MSWFLPTSSFRQQHGLISLTLLLIIISTMICILPVLDKDDCMLFTVTVPKLYSFAGMSQGLTKSST